MKERTTSCPRRNLIASFYQDVTTFPYDVLIDPSFVVVHSNIHQLITAIAIARAAIILIPELRILNRECIHDYRGCLIFKLQASSSKCCTQYEASRCYYRRLAALRSVLLIIKSTELMDTLDMRTGVRCGSGSLAGLSSRELGSITSV